MMASRKLYDGVFINGRLMGYTSFSKILKICPNTLSVKNVMASHCTAAGENVEHIPSPVLALEKTRSGIIVSVYFLSSNHLCNARFLPKYVMD